MVTESPHVTTTRRVTRPRCNDDDSDSDDSDECDDDDDYYDDFDIFDDEFWRYDDFEYEDDYSYGAYGDDDFNSLYNIFGDFMDWWSTDYGFRKRRSVAPGTEAARRNQNQDVWKRKDLKDNTKVGFTY